MVIVDQDVAKISTSKCSWSFEEMKSVKAVGPDDTPVEVWKHQGDVAMML